MIFVSLNYKGEYMYKIHNIIRIADSLRNKKKYHDEIYLRVLFCGYVLRRDIHEILLPHWQNKAVRDKNRIKIILV